jgi:nucleoside-diphosphate-sugar epimerase
VLFPNTNSGYGIAEDAPCDETSPLLPISVYGRTKCEAERVVMERENAIAFRLATVFGASPRMRTDLLVQDFVQRACCSLPLVLYQPNARRNFVHIRDVARAFLWALAEPKMRGQVFNCGDTRANMTKLQLCEAVKRRVPSFAWTIGEGSDPDKRDYVVINDKLERTGWRPGYTLDDGIVELIKAFTMIGDRKLGNA